MWVAVANFLDLASQVLAISGSVMIFPFKIFKDKNDILQEYRNKSINLNENDPEKVLKEYYINSTGGALLITAFIAQLVKIFITTDNKYSFFFYLIVALMVVIVLCLFMQRSFKSAKQLKK